MLTHPTHEALSALKLDGMAEAFAELIAEDRGRSLDPVAWIGLMLDREQARRGTRRFQSRLRAANLRHGDACMEDVDYRTSRGLDRALFLSLGSPDWIDRHRSVLISGPCVIESEALCQEVAGRLLETTRALGIPYVFKAS